MKNNLAQVAIAALLMVGAASTALAAKHASHTVTAAHVAQAQADKTCPLGCTGHCPLGSKSASAMKATSPSAAGITTVAMVSAQKADACTGVNAASCPKGCPKKAAHTASTAVASR